MSDTDEMRQELDPELKREIEIEVRGRTESARKRMRLSDKMAKVAEATRVAILENVAREMARKRT